MDKFSFPVIIPGHDDDHFEFGCDTTPVDHLFANGKLLPHVFPIQTGPITNYYSFSRSTSSVSSKDYSSVSSHSNSRSSSSARTSTSESVSSFSARGLSSNRLPARKERNRPVLGPQVYGSLQRWQLIAAAQVLKKQHAGSRSKVEVLDRNMSRKSRPVEEHDGAAKTSWFGKRILKLFVSACKECHAITT